MPDLSAEMVERVSWELPGHIAAQRGRVFARGAAMAAGAKMGLRGFFRAEGVGATRKEAGEIHRSQNARGDGAAVRTNRKRREIPLCATRRAKTARKKKPGRFVRNDGKRPERGG